MDDFGSDLGEAMPETIEPPLDTIEEPLDVEEPLDIEEPLDAEDPLDIEEPLDLEESPDVEEPTDEPVEVTETGWELLDAEEVRSRLGADTLWTEDPFERGRNYEVLRDANIGGNFPTIDHVDPDTATGVSLKTLDLTADTYQNVGPLNATVKGYIDDLAGFQDTVWHQDGEEIAVRRDDLAALQLELAVPAGKASAEQVGALNALHDYAAEKGVSFVIKEVP